MAQIEHQLTEMERDTVNANLAVNATVDHMAEIGLISAEEGEHYLLTHAIVLVKPSWWKHLTGMRDRWRFAVVAVRTQDGAST